MENKKNDVCRCIARVYRWGALRPHRCSNPVWKDGYCKTHHAVVAEKDREIERLTEELDSHSWEISPAMAQQRIDNSPNTKHAYSEPCGKCERIVESIPDPAEAENDIKKYFRYVSFNSERNPDVNSKGENHA